MTHKKSRKPLIKLFLLVLGTVLLLLAIRFMDGSPEQSAVVAEERPATGTDSDEIRTTAITGASAKGMKARSTVEPEFRSVEPFESEDQFLLVLDESDLFNGSELTHIVERMKASKAEELAGYLHKALRESGENEKARRNRILLIAEAWRSEELLPLWKDLALRRTPLVKDEAAALGSPEPTEISRAIELEVLTAIGNLGIIGPRKAEAVQVLKDLILQPDPKLHSLFLRERAFFALQEARLTASLVVLKSLPDDDPLRSNLAARINSAAK